MCRRDINFTDLEVDLNYLNEVEHDLTENEYNIFNQYNTEEKNKSSLIPANITKVISTHPHISFDVIEEIPLSDVDNIVEKELLGEPELFEDDDEDVYNFWSDFDVEDASPTTDKQYFNVDKLSRADKARQVAINFIAEQELDESDMSFIEEVFITLGYGKTRTALINALSTGHCIESIKRAFWIKLIWAGSPHFWQSFKGNLNTHSNRTFDYCSWVQALSVVSVLPENIGYEELIDFLENEHECWFISSTLRKTYPQFIRYLFVYRCDNKNMTFAENGFVAPSDYESESLEWVNQPLHPDMQFLDDLGLLSNSHHEISLEVAEC